MKWRSAHRRLVILATVVVCVVAIVPAMGAAWTARPWAAGLRGGEGASFAPPQEVESPLREVGNAAYAAVLEAVRELEARPGTDWSKVDLEALRRHLLDMERFTLEAEVVSEEAVPGGLRVTVRGTSPEATRSIQRAVGAHGPQLAREMGWTVDVRNGDGVATLRVTSADPAEAARIRGLGYIGLMATGAHHQEHHWAIANGGAPHDHRHGR